MARSYLKAGKGVWIVVHILYKNSHDRPSLQRPGPAYRGESVSTPHFLVHSPKDNVGVVVVEGLKAGTDMLGVVTETDKTLKLKAKAPIPIGHKVALKALKKGETVIKYGEDIGRMVADANVGDHVHVQNLKTKRW
jgi:(2R)-sulfolactate sulfo-lyase subunit alpha